MKKSIQFIFILSFMFLLSNCSKKTVPTTSTSTNTTEVPKPVSAKVARSPKANPVKTSTPKVISVNDSAAKKTFDGKYYYDLEGHRYWKNYKDGKYYIYSKKMNTDPDFKAP